MASIKKRMWQHPEKEGKQIISNFWTHFKSVNCPTWHKNKNRKAHTTIYFMVCLIIQLYLLSHVTKSATRDGMVLMARFTMPTVYFDDGHCFYFFLISASNRNQLLTDVLWIRVKLLGGWVLYCLLLLQNSTAMIFGSRALLFPQLMHCFGVYSHCSVSWQHLKCSIMVSSMKNCDMTTKAQLNFFCSSLIWQPEVKGLVLLQHFSPLPDWSTCCSIQPLAGLRSHPFSPDTALFQTDGIRAPTNQYDYSIIYI